MIFDSGSQDHRDGACGQRIQLLLAGTFVWTHSVRITFDVAITNYRGLPFREGPAQQEVLLTSGTVARPTANRCSIAAKPQALANAPLMTARLKSVDAGHIEQHCSPE